MKRPPKLPSGQFTLSLSRQPSLQIESPSKEELLNVLADPMREALSPGQEPNDEQREHADEPQNHA